MKKTTSATLALVASLILFQMVPAVALAEEDETGWSDVAEFSWVQTAGNSETATFGLKNTLTRTWEKSKFKLSAGGIRAESTAETVRAFGDPDAPDFDVDSVTTTTAENYYLKGRYDRKITDRFFWYAGAGWDRNRPAGIDNRYMAKGGVGNIWFDREDMKFQTDYALTYTDQEDVFEQPDVDNKFVGLLFSWEYLNKIGENTTYENLLGIDANLEETSDYRIDMINSVAVAINAHLALKLSLQWLYDNEPAFKSIDLFDIDPNLPGAILIGQAPYELDSLDTLFTASLVVNF
jgi:putative salt-induced outer membrane protein YdiY